MLATSCTSSASSTFVAPELLHVSYVSQASYNTHITLCQELTKMPQLANVEKGPLPKAQCVPPTSNMAPGLASRCWRGSQYMRSGTT